MNGLLERLATSCPKTWEGSGDLSGSQGDGMQGQETLSPSANQRPRGTIKPMRGRCLGSAIIPLGMQTRWGS